MTDTSLPASSKGGGGGGGGGAGGGWRRGKGNFGEATVIAGAAKSRQHAVAPTKVADQVNVRLLDPLLRRSSRRQLPWPCSSWLLLLLGFQGRMHKRVTHRANALTQISRIKIPLFTGRRALIKGTAGICRAQEALGAPALRLPQSQQWLLATRPSEFTGRIPPTTPWSTSTTSIFQCQKQHRPATPWARTTCAHSHFQRRTLPAQEFVECTTVARQSTAGSILLYKLQQFRRVISKPLQSRVAVIGRILLLVSSSAGDRTARLLTSLPPSFPPSIPPSLPADAYQLGAVAGLLRQMIGFFPPCLAAELRMCSWCLSQALFLPYQCWSLLLWSLSLHSWMYRLHGPGPKLKVSTQPRLRIL